MTTNPTPRVDGKYGAPMGRRSDNLSGLIVEPHEKVTLRRVPINSGGYDSGGAYWGLGAPLYWWCVTQEGEESSGFLRACSRAAAKNHILELHPNAVFFR